MKTQIMFFVMLALGAQLTQAQTLYFESDTVETYGKNAIAATDTGFVVTMMNGINYLHSIHPFTSEIKTTDVPMISGYLHGANIIQRSDYSLVVRPEGDTVWNTVGNFAVAGSDILKVDNFYYLCGGDYRLKRMDSITGNYDFIEVAIPGWQIKSLATDGEWIYVSGSDNNWNSVFGRWHIENQIFQELWVRELPQDTENIDYLSSLFPGVVFLDGDLYIYTYIVKRVEGLLYRDMEIVKFDLNNNQHNTIFEADATPEEDMSGFDDFSGIYINDRLIFALIDSDWDNGSGDEGQTLLVRQVLPTPPVVDLGEDTASCDGDVISLDAGAGFESYLWSTGEETQTIDVTEAGSYSVTVTNQFDLNGSDTIEVDFNPTYFFEEQATICEGDFFEWQGENYTEAGTYTAEYTTVNGCDSTYQLTLTVNPTYFFEEEASICDGDFFEWQGENYTEAGVYTTQYTTVNGCDSVYQLTLNVNPTFFFEEQATICEGESFEWQGGSYTQAGVYTAAYITAAGCDSVYQLTVIVNPLPVVDLGEDIETSDESVVLDAGAGFESYLWSTGEETQTIEVNVTSDYSVTVTNGSGCQNADTITVTFTANEPPVITDVLQDVEFPVNGEAVTIAATITDDNEVSVARLLWGIESGVYTDSVDMTSTDDVYTASITSEEDSLNIFYAVKAVDNQRVEALSEEQGYYVYPALVGFDLDEYPGGRFLYSDYGTGEDSITVNLVEMFDLYPEMEYELDLYPPTVVEAEFDGTFLFVKSFPSDENSSFPVIFQALNSNHRVEISMEIRFEAPAVGYTSGTELNLIDRIEILYSPLGLQIDHPENNTYQKSLTLMNAEGSYTGERTDMQFNTSDTARFYRDSLPDDIEAGDTFDVVLNLFYGTKEINVPVNNATVVVTGIFDLGKYTGLTLSVFPNPVAGKFTVELPRQNGQVTITDITGRTIYRDTFKPHEQKRTIDISNYQPGYYIIFTTSGNGHVASQKLIKK